MTKGARGVCTVDGCGRPHKARGYCAVHYQHWMRGVTINPVVRTRDRNGPEMCTADGCEAEVKAKGLCTMHYARQLRHGHIANRGRTKPTKSCTIAGCDNHFYALGMCHQHWLRSRRSKERFDLTLDDLAAMQASQGGGCAICLGTKMRPNWRSGKQDSLHIDHCHASGKSRGLLCDNCNRAIGLLGDEPETLRAAAAYLERHTFLHALPERTPAADGSVRDYLTLPAAPAVGLPS